MRQVSAAMVIERVEAALARKCNCKI